MARGLTLKKMSDVRRLAARVINLVFKGQMPESQGRALLYGASILKDIIRESDLEVRISELEKQMKERENEQKY